MIEQVLFGRFWDDNSKPGPLLKCMGDKPLVTLFYPKAGWTGAGNKLSKKLWMSYFSFYDFRRPKPTEDWPQSDDYEILHWPEWVYS